MKYSFPAIFEVDKADPKFINVCFPDILGAYTCGIGEDDAIFMAKDLLKGLLGYGYIKDTIPKSLEETQNNFPDLKVLLITVEV